MKAIAVDTSSGGRVGGIAFLDGTGVLGFFAGEFRVGGFGCKGGSSGCPSRLWVNGTPYRLRELRRPSHCYGIVGVAGYVGAGVLAGVREE
jgi:hypothetical protein